MGYPRLPPCRNEPQVSNIFSVLSTEVRVCSMERVVILDRNDCIILATETRNRPNFFCLASSPFLLSPLQSSDSSLNELSTMSSSISIPDPFSRAPMNSLPCSIPFSNLGLLN